MRYTGNRWAIYNENATAMTEPLAWNVFIPPLDDTLIVHTGDGTPGSRTFIDNPLFNNTPNAVIFVQHVFNPGGAATSAPGFVGDNYTHTVAVPYDTGRNQWSIMNTDRTQFPAGITFFALKASADETLFQHISTDANDLTTDGTFIDNPATNGNPDAMILVTQNYATGVTNSANDHQLGLYYDYPRRRWAIFNQDIASISPGIMYNVLVIPPKSGFFAHTATLANTTLNATALDNADLNNNPHALIYVTQNWNPPEAPNDILNNSPVGADYIGGAWYIINVDGAPMPVGA